VLRHLSKSVENHPRHDDTDGYDLSFSSWNVNCIMSRSSTFDI